MRRVILPLAFLLLCSSLVHAQDRRGPFTHAKRSVRTRDVDQKHIRLDLRFDWDKQEVQGRATLNLSTFKKLREITLDASDMEITQVTLLPGKSDTSPRELKHTHKQNKLSIQLDQVSPAGADVDLQIEYVFRNPTRGVHFVVPDETEPDQPRMAWTQNEPEYASHWFPCIDSPADRLTSEIVATVPADFFVLSNGVLKSKQRNQDGTQTWHWRQPKSHVAYLMSVVAGRFEALEQEWAGIPITSYVPVGRIADAPRSFEKTPQMMEFFSRKIGVVYPWSKYTQICVDEYQWGGMEHTSATTLTLGTLHDERAHLDTSSDNLVAHELIHQWFGDLLTCKDWGELWLNESFATYFATLWQEEDEGWDEATWKRYQEANGYKGEDKKYRRSIVNYNYNDPSKMFDGHSYPKGGRVLHMLRFVLGDEMFWKSINRYTTVNQHRCVETADFRIAIEDATGRGLNWFFDQWLYHGGHPDFHVEWDWNADSNTASVTVKQTQKVNDITPLFRMPVEIEIATTDDTVIRRVELSKAEETFHFQSDERPTRVCFDPNDWLLKTLEFFKSKEELLDQLANDEHIMCRARAAQSLTEYKEHGDAAAALCRAATDDKFWAVRQEAAKSLGKFKGDDVRECLLAVAKTDAKSFVRRAAITSLAQFKHDDTNAALRQVVKDDRSYYAVAAALKSLMKVDRDGCSADLLAALNRKSHRQVIVKAALEGLVELKNDKAANQVEALLAVRSRPNRQAVLAGGLARLQPDDKDARQQLLDLLGDDRRGVRSIAVNAIVAIGDPAAIESLEKKRDEVETPGARRALDDAIEKLTAKRGKGDDELKKELAALRKQNDALEERLEKLERRD